MPYYTIHQVKHVYNSLNACSGCSICPNRNLRNYMENCGLEEFQKKLNEDTLPENIKKVFETRIKILQKCIKS